MKPMLSGSCATSASGSARPLPSGPQTCQVPALELERDDSSGVRNVPPRQLSIFFSILTTNKKIWICKGFFPTDAESKYVETDSHNRDIQWIIRSATAFRVKGSGNMYAGALTPRQSLPCGASVAQLPFTNLTSPSPRFRPSTH